MWLWAKSCWQSLEAGRGESMVPEVLKRNQPAATLISVALFQATTLAGICQRIHWLCLEDVKRRDGWREGYICLEGTWQWKPQSTAWTLSSWHFREAVVCNFSTQSWRMWSWETELPPWDSASKAFTMHHWDLPDSICPPSDRLLSSGSPSPCPNQELQENPRRKVCHTGKHCP